MGEAGFNSPETKYYFERFGFCARQIADPPPTDLERIVVIPCYNEPDLIESLEALLQCTRPEGSTEVIVVVNSGQGSSKEVLEQNERTVSSARDWAVSHGNTHLVFHILHFPELPKKKAGVGLARKIGMDEALRRFDAVNRLDGVILCFDADCRCDPNYLVAVDRYFLANTASPGCSIYFEHPLEGDEEPSIYDAIQQYELHLRYYIEGLRYAGFPHAYHTIGSSMAVRANAYRMQGGMNTRQAGEDFYFLHKIIPLGRFGEVNDARVIPSPRPSDRVPFGTGRAVIETLRTNRFESYPIESFRDLRALFLKVPGLYEQEAMPSLLPAMEKFLAARDFAKILEEIRKNTSTESAFVKRFFRWFDGFLAMKYIHFAQEKYYEPGRLPEVASQLLAEVSIRPPITEIRLLLEEYRARQKRGWSRIS